MVPHFLALEGIRSEEKPPPLRALFDSAETLSSRGLLDGIRKEVSLPEDYDDVRSRGSA
jgi:hypothetical protein